MYYNSGDFALKFCREELFWWLFGDCQIPNCVIYITSFDDETSM